MSGTLSLIARLVGALEERARAEAVRGARRTLVAALAAAIGAGALVWLSLAAFLALGPVLGAAWAALILALVWALVAAGILIWSLAGQRRRRPKPAIPEELTGELSRALGGNLKDAAPLLALGALVAGLLAAGR